MNSLSIKSLISNNDRSLTQKELPAGAASNDVNIDSINPKIQSNTFSELLTNSLAEVNSLQVQANKEMEKLATGKSESLHETMLAVERAEIAFKSMNQIRTKVLDAYKEIIRMQL